MNFRLIELVKDRSLILCNSKFTACNFERTLNIRPPSIVSVAVLLTNIHKSRAVTLYLIKHRILIRGAFIDIKSLRCIIDHLIG